MSDTDALSYDPRRSHRLLAVVGALCLLTGCGEGDPTDPVFDPLVIMSTSLPDGVQNEPYGATLAAMGGDAMYRWAVIGAMSLGSPPAGLTVQTNGEIVGIPSFVETRGFTVEVRSGDGQTAERAFSITVEAAPK